MTTTTMPEPIEIVRAHDGYLLVTSTVIDRPLDEVFGFFADAGNLERITPPMLKFEILTPRPIEMRRGAIIDYRIRVRGVPVKWKTEITAWEPGRRFVDEQRRGPYKLWVHEHTFEQTDEGVVVADRVRYRPPLAWLTHPLMVERDLRGIFGYRQRAMRECLGS